MPFQKSSKKSSGIGWTDKRARSPRALSVSAESLGTLRESFNTPTGRTLLHGVALSCLGILLKRINLTANSAGEISRSSRGLDNFGPERYCSRETSFQEKLQARLIDKTIEREGGTLVRSSLDSLRPLITIEPRMDIKRATLGSQRFTVDRTTVKTAPDEQLAERRVNLTSRGGNLCRAKVSSFVPGHGTAPRIFLPYRLLFNFDPLRLSSNFVPPVFLLYFPSGRPEL